MTDTADIRVLLVEGDANRASTLASTLRDPSSDGAFGGCEVVHADSVVAALRQLQGGFFDLLMTNTSVQRTNDALKLVDVLLVERKVSRTIPVIVFSEQQDPAVIKHLAQAGISEYILLTGDAGAILPRVSKVLAGTNIGERLVGEATIYLGPAARVLVDKGTRVHLKMSGLEALRREHLPGLFAWIRTTVTPILRNKAAALMTRLENAFPTKGAN